jgi:hypothetical protein
MTENLSGRIDVLAAYPEVRPPGEEGGDAPLDTSITLPLSRWEDRDA